MTSSSSPMKDNYGLAEKKWRAQLEEILDMTHSPPVDPKEKAT